MRVNKNETLANFKQPEIRSEKSRGLTEVSENKRAPINESYLRGFLKDTAELIDSQPTVGNAWKKYWSERGVNNIDDYKVQVTTKSKPNVFQAFSLNPHVDSELKTLSAFDYVAHNNHNYYHPKVLNKNSSIPLSINELNQFKLPEYQKELQEHYFEENTGKIKNFASQYPELAVIAAINKGTIPEDSMNILSSVENGNGEVLLPNLGPYKSASLVMLRDNDSQQSLLINMNPLQTGSNVSHFDNNTEMQKFFKNEKNEEFILSHFNLYDIQDGVFVKGAKEHLDNVQHRRKVHDGVWVGSALGTRGPTWEPASDMEFTSFSQLNDKYGNEYVNRLKTQFTNNADVLTVSDSERRTKQGLEIAQPIIDGLSIAASPFFPIAAAGIGLISGVGIPFYKALTADTQAERNESSLEVLTNIVMEGVTNIPVAGVGQAVRGVPKPEGELPSFRPNEPVSVSYIPIKDKTNPFGYDLPTIKEKPEVLVSNPPPSKKPRLTLDANHNVSYNSEGTYEYATKKTYKGKNNFRSHEAEHSIGMDVLVNPYQYTQKPNLAQTDVYPDNTPFRELNSAAKPTKYNRYDYPKLTNAAPAYQEFKPLHIAHIGTGLGNPISDQKGVEGLAVPTTSRPNVKKEQKNFDSGYYPNKYRAEQRSSIEKGNIGEAIAFNQEAYSNSPAFRFFYRSEKLESDGSWTKLAEGSPSWLQEANQLKLTNDLQSIGIPLNQSPQQIVTAMNSARKNINASYYLQTKLPELHWVDYPPGTTGAGTIQTTQITDEHRIEMIRARHAAISGDIPGVHDVLDITKNYNINKGDGTPFTYQDIDQIMLPTDADKVRKAYDELILGGNTQPTAADVEQHLKSQHIKSSLLNITRPSQTNPNNIQTKEVDIDIKTIQSILSIT